MIQLREFNTTRLINLMPDAFNRNEYRDVWGDVWEKVDPMGFNNYVRRKKNEDTRNKFLRGPGNW